MQFDGSGSVPSFSLAADSVVIWGPFPLRRARLCIGLALLGLAILMGWIGTIRDSISCARRGPRAGQCELRGGARGDPLQSFELSSITDVSVKYTESHRRKQTVKRGEVVVHLASGELHMKRETPQGAEANVEALRSFLRNANADTVHVVTQREWWGIIFVGMFGLGGAGMLYTVLAGRRRIRCTWNSFTQQLTVQREWPLGIFTSEPQTLTLKRPASVDIAWGRVDDFFSSSRSPGPPGGRLCVTCEGGESQSIDPETWFGYGVHVRAAEQLRSLLGCAPKTPAERERIEAANRAAKPMPSPQWTTAFGKVALAWLGICTGSLIGLAISATIAVGFRFQKSSDPAGGFWFVSGVFGGAALGVWLVFRLALNPDER